MKKTIALLFLITAWNVSADDHSGLDYNVVTLNAKAEQEVPNDLMKVTFTPVTSDQ